MRTPDARSPAAPIASMIHVAGSGVTNAMASGWRSPVVISEALIVAPVVASYSPMV